MNGNSDAVRDFYDVLKTFTEVKPPFRGIVEDNDDPEGRNRVRVRVPFLYGVPNTGESYIPTAVLPWAEVPTASAGNDRGSSIVPHIGDIAIITLENNDPYQPICIGFIHKLGLGNVNHDGSANETAFTDRGGVTQTVLMSSTVPEQAIKGGSPIEIIHKSSKGAEIGIYGQDGKETLRIVDSLGQIIEFGHQMEPGTSPHRYKGDRSRKDSLQRYNKNGSSGNNGSNDSASPDSNNSNTSDSIGETGYILLQNANTSGEDSKLLLSDNLVQIENGVGNITVELDQVTIYNGKQIIKLTDESAYISNGSSIIAISNDTSEDELSKSSSRAIKGFAGNVVGGSDENSSGGSSDKKEESITLTNAKCVVKLEGENMLISAPDTINMSAGKYINITAGTAITITCGSSNIIMAMNSIIMEGTVVTIAGLSSLNLLAGKLMTLFATLIEIN